MKGVAFMIDTYSVALSELVKEFDLQIEFASTDYDSIRLTVEDVSRPGIQLAGYFDHFDPMRLQVLGNVEMSYVAKLVSSTCSQLSASSGTMVPSASCLTRFSKMLTLTRLVTVL